MDRGGKPSCSYSYMYGLVKHTQISFITRLIKVMDFFINSSLYNKTTRFSFPTPPPSPLDLFRFFSCFTKGVLRAAEGLQDPTTKLWREALSALVRPQRKTEQTQLEISTLRKTPQSILLRCKYLGIIPILPLCTPYVLPLRWISLYSPPLRSIERYTVNLTKS